MLAERGPDLPAQGRDRAGDGPARRRDPRAGQLAAGGRQRPRRRAGRTRARTARWRRATSRARPSRRSRSRARCRRGWSRPSTTFDLPPQIQVADRTISEAHDRGAETLTRGADPRAVVEHRRGEDRAEARRATASTTGCARFGFGQPTGVDLPGEAPGIVLQPDQYSGSSMGNLPIGQGIAVTPIQMAAGLLGDRQRRRDAPPARRRRATRAPGKRVISRRTPPPGVADARGRAGPGGTATEAASPATSWPARPAPRRSPTSTAATRRPSTSPRSSASRRPATRACSWQ